MVVSDIGRWKFFQRILVRLNADCLTWDDSFSSRGSSVEWITTFCKRWKIQTDPWIWKKPIRIMRRRMISLQDVTTRSPCRLWVTGSVAGDVRDDLVQSYFRNAETQEQDWNVDESIGIPNVHMYKDNSCAIFYLSPTDYHCFPYPLRVKSNTSRF